MRPKLAGVKPISVDACNFESVMDRMGPEVRLGENGEAPALRFSTMDDFHPDEIYARAIIFDAVRKAGKELKDNVIFAPGREVREPAAVRASLLAGGSSLLDAIVDAAPQGSQ